ncbi:MAG: hypothetical protein HY936_10405 [Nitrosomonadales bacterium]|nr:hypothetical protein [Nitrosomonadales bacterium]
MTTSADKGAVRDVTQVEKNDGGGHCYRVASPLAWSHCSTVRRPTPYDHFGRQGCGTRCDTN